MCVPGCLVVVKPVVSHFTNMHFNFMACLYFTQRMYGDNHPNQKRKYKKTSHYAEIFQLQNHKEQFDVCQ